MPERSQFVCFLEPKRADMPTDPTPEEQAAVAAHFAYYQGLHERGDLILAGRTTEAPFVGLFIFEAESRRDAEQLVNEDPGIHVFEARIQSYRAALMR